MFAAFGALIGITAAGFTLLLAALFRPDLMLAMGIAVAGAAIVGATLGAGVGVGVAGKEAMGKKVDDAYITKEGVTQRFSEDDNILLTKSGLGGGDSRMVAALGRIESALSRRQTIDLRGDQAFVERRYNRMEKDNTYAGLATGTA